MKFHWGHGILVFLVIFVLSVAFVVYKGFQEDVLLVEKEYYPKGLEYDEQIRRIQNANALGSRILLEERKDTIRISYPDFFRRKDLTGTIYFYRPSDDAGDITVDIRPDSSLVQLFSAVQLMKGRYTVKMQWSAAGKEYYQEESIYIHH